MFCRVVGTCRRVGHCVTLLRGSVWQRGHDVFYRTAPTRWREIDLESNPFYEKYSSKLKDVVGYVLCVVVIGEYRCFISSWYRPANLSKENLQIVYLKA